MKLFKGLAVSPGIVIGKVLLIDDDLRRVARRMVNPGAVHAEVARFDDAVQKSIDELNLVHARAQKEMGDETAKIFLFHATLLRDPSLVLPIRVRIEQERVSAEFAASQAFLAFADRFRSMRDSMFATKVNDIEDLASRLLTHLLGRTASRLENAPPDTVVVARDLTPSQTAGFDRSRILGFATDLGGKTSHTAIVAKALDIPAVVGCQMLLTIARDGMGVILDGDSGTVVLDPNDETLANYRRTMEQRRLFKLSLSDVSDLPCVTADGQPVQLLGNIEFPDELKSVVAAGGEGVGLYRTEFLYLTRPVEPSEDDHFVAYQRCVQLAQGRDLTIRTVDLGADKYTQSRTEIPERNPFLGCRSIRYCLRDLPMFKRQLRALLRASAIGPIKIMFPLITSLSEFRHARLLVHDVMEELEEEGISFDRHIPIGMMVEVPSAAILSEQFAREADFFSIGTNDLVQYTLAVDRTNERIANLYSHTHPAVIRLIRDVARSANRHEIPVSCCGEAAADPEYAILLLGLGLRTLSVSSSAIAALKRIIRSVSAAQCERIARAALGLESDTQINLMLRDRARKLVPHAYDHEQGLT
jgi:phosphotransferase system enzyme I (PtsI)